MRHFWLQTGQFQAVILALDEQHARQRFEEELFPGCLPEFCEAAEDIHATADVDAAPCSNPSPRRQLDATANPFAHVWCDVDAALCG